MLRRFHGLILTAFFAVTASCLGKPALYIIGDSTVRNSTIGQTGWGDPLVAYFDPTKVEVINRAIGGRSSRTFLTEGRWDAVMAHLKPGDYVLMQFGHNDGGELNDDRCRASLKGIGSETENIVRKTDGKTETVKTYGAYLRQYINDTKFKGAIPLVVSPIPRNIWKDGKIARDSDTYSKWAQQIADQEQIPFIPFNQILCNFYESIGQNQTSALFAGTDHTHTGSAGAELNAEMMASAIRSLTNCQLGDTLLPADLWLPGVFSDHMVLQRNMPLPIWGHTIPGTMISIKIAGHESRVMADAHGCWRVEMPALPAGGPFILEVTSSTTRRAYQDVLIGEVWLCSGQSNMDFTLASTAKRSFSGVTDWKNVVAAANHPKLRMFTAEWTMRESPQRDVAGTWVVCSPATAGDFSAVAYYFGLSLQQYLDVPIGLVTCAYGASTIEAWIGDETLRAHPQALELLNAYADKMTNFRDHPKLYQDYGMAIAKTQSGKPPKNPDPVQDQHNPSVLHNGMIAPIAPYAIRGAIWYQGESNLNTRQIYKDLQQALIQDWRSLWKNPDLPFYYVQLAAHNAPSTDPAPGGQLAEMRESQTQSLTIPHTGMAVTIDIGDAKDIHPRNKLDVGNRLARLALTGTYDKPGIPSGPLFRTASVENGRIRVHFNNADTGLIAKNGDLRGFAIASSDCKFTVADAQIEGDSIVLTSPLITNPTYARYAWSDNPADANLCNADGLPAAPFRTDP